MVIAIIAVLVLAVIGGIARQRLVRARREDWREIASWKR